jgi:membrane associated rhomboid family serine protease
MLPLRDSEALQRLPPANTILILSNILVFALELRSAHGRMPIIEQFAMVPARIAHLDWALPGSAAAALATLITSLFLHGGVLHIAGNMLYLLVFGPAVEGRLGHVRFFGFYLLAGTVAGLATVAMAPQSRVPVIGASGAIAGVLGGYLALYPGARISTLLPASSILGRVEVPAILYLLVWFALQLYSGILSGPAGPHLSGVAWWAHVGGFLFGVAAVPLIATRPPKRRRARA